MSRRGAACAPARSLYFLRRNPYSNMPLRRTFHNVRRIWRNSGPRVDRATSARPVIDHGFQGACDVIQHCVITAHHYVDVSHFGVVEHDSLIIKSKL